ncbi:phosphoribosylanthranilate isomerase [Gluconobacter roseus]|uniref:N-(5'-phosphoribosyl)anthranilate isomerase n=1 Tax=Gluconobacter roseus NBRC 3990 TaxID=1307950 RepID=A0A4Y3M4J9_9PROT|nr:phosphoribosylanthranilate isomerase [Gluconobacter roseus]KXV43391.1 N-(5'-phosphoribosyl)anthranilate isomerase [Gluconobacter roseus]GBR42215.1 phosphoribosyl anthranilate isomerase [Gluconobacter roseus NBRC 3990]GEB03544.1 N-(5'-phosphoribosyl)anthranilate isomerase [Gluconobacter roseus NBRC 3990]GLP93999.1 N-(5'-phosphoribosyl)anthranilate isomerase [Gluconobacter roseus NBRC 3990]
MTGVKICGIRDTRTMELCAGLKVDWVGFVFCEASPRFVTAEEALSLHDSVPASSEGGPFRVGLFVKPDDRLIEQTVKKVPLDVLQIYDTPARAIEIQSRFERPVWRACGIASQADLPTDPRLSGYVIEAPRQEQDSRPGGLGRTFDWSLTQNWTSPSFWMLAGGLNPLNVQHAIQESQAPAVDVSSGVEASPGHKSSELIEKFVRNARKGLDLMRKLS